MARSDLLLALVRAGTEHNHERFQRALEALVAEERAKQHHILADRLAAHLKLNGNGNGHTSHAVQAPASGKERQLFVERSPRRALDELVLPDHVLTACRELIEEHHRADLLRAHGIEPRHRVLLVGPPGNGKTSLAEAVATELAVPLLVVRYESLIGSYLGETATRLGKLFEHVRTRRCVLFFDEFDVIGKERGDVHETGEIKRVVSSLLLQVDRLPSHVVVVTATNHAELLDRAVWRRFELRLDLPTPTRAQRVAWLEQFEARTGVAFERSLDGLASKLEGTSFSELEQFALDVRRRYVLAIPSGDMKSIVASRLQQWSHRVVPGGEGTAE